MFNFYATCSNGVTDDNKNTTEFPLEPRLEILLFYFYSTSEIIFFDG